jgi:glyoxylate/hydroxypyruvate reductase
VVDSDALARALNQGKIFGAGVDVVEGEPHVLSDHPLVKEPRCQFTVALCLIDY